MAKILLATNNKGKLVEIQALMRELGLQASLLTPQDLHLDLHVEEDGQTYAENAARKAIAFSRASTLPTLADDSGLEVDTLDGAPGIYSARFSPLANPTDADRRAYLLEKLRGRPRPWTARFRCVLAIVTASGKEVDPKDLHFAEGVCPGEIISQERGQNGFGYDPLFYLPELGRTMAELPMEAKNHISHRARAVRAARPFLVEILRS
jgi:XTP/dITP diphosphohydrolase